MGEEAAATLNSQSAKCVVRSVSAYLSKSRVDPRKLSKSKQLCREKKIKSAYIKEGETGKFFGQFNTNPIWTRLLDFNILTQQIANFI
jgi:hypothetical protein